MRGTSEGVNMNAFYYLFCKIDSLCANGEPNLLGWAVIVCGGLFLLYLVLKFFGIIRSVD
jgi:hypothetical protein